MHRTPNSLDLFFTDDLNVYALLNCDYLGFF
jgi:hypothetical protein